MLFRAGARTRFGRRCDAPKEISRLANRQAFLDDLQQTLDKFAVPEAEQAQIKTIVAGTRADIVVQEREGVAPARSA